MTFQYQILAEQIADKIQQGELQAGQRLISLRQCAEQQNVSINTVKNCYELLEGS